MEEESMLRHARVATLAVSAVAGLMVFSEPADAQRAYPERPIRLVVPFAPGGNTDIMGRRYAAKMAGPLGQHMVVENRAGGGGTVGAAEVARGKPDGYTLLVATSSSHAINPTAMPDIPYDAIKDFTPISVLGTTIMAVAIHPSVPVKTLDQLVAVARSKPDVYSYGSAGVGSINHLTGELFKMKAGGLRITHVPYRGSGASVTDLIAGQIPIVMTTLSAALEPHRQGRVRVLAVANDVRSVAAPDIPTAIEAGVPDMIAYTFAAILAPAGTPRPIVNRIHEATATIMADPAFQKELIGLGAEPIKGSNPDKALKFLQTEVARWRPVILATGTTAR
jgi:tripartite-type tricarboxylate transporter receptor subunit TctC